jgi:hypothetical protein
MTARGLLLALLLLSLTGCGHVSGLYVRLQSSPLAAELIRLYYYPVIVDWQVPTPESLARVRPDPPGPRRHYDAWERYDLMLEVW